MQKSYKTLKEYLELKGLKHTPQRVHILDIFLNTKRHLTADELYFLVRKKHPEIGRTTVYRTLKLLCEAEIATVVYFRKRIARYEVKVEQEHHDHLVCVECGRFFEVFDEKIEKLQDKLSLSHNFVPLNHRLEIFGLCKKCVKNRGKKKND
jgi:Fur family ferric uptake transcriptional regulator